MAWSKLKPLVTFRFNPQKQPKTAKQKKAYQIEKRRVRQYFQTLKDFQGSRQTVVYRPRDKRKLKPAQAYAQMDPRESKWRVAFIPGVPGTKVRIRGKRVTTYDKHIERVIWYFKHFERYRGERARNPKAVADRILKKDKLSKRFRGLCGKSETEGTWDRNLLWKLLDNFTHSYGNHNDWFHGVVGYRFNKQTSFRAYRKARRNAKRDRSRRKRALLRKS